MLLDLLILDSGHTLQVTCSTPLPSLNILGLSVIKLSNYVSHWLPLTMYLQPVHMHQSTWPQLAYLLCNLYWATVTMKGHLYSGFLPLGDFWYITYMSLWLTYFQPFHQVWRS